ncbi:EndoU domain-containing protein [Erwinia sp. S38]|nr:EndoU domain-containing protein [Erwinia sp. S38]
MAACSGPAAASDDCKHKRAEAVLAQMGYEKGPYNSQYKYAYPDEYQHIQDILNVTSQKTQDQLAIRDAVAHSLAKKDKTISLEQAYAKYDRFTATRDVIAIVGGTIGGIGVANRIPGEKAVGSVGSAGKGATGTGSSKAGEYLEDFKPSPTPAELVQQQAGKGTQVTINTEHILNGEIKTYANGTKVAVGGHYLKDQNIKVDKWSGAADANGVKAGYISVRDPATGKGYKKQAETTFFPENWSKRQTEMEIKSAFENSKPHTDPRKKEMWQGISSSGLKIEGYYKKPDGAGATAWPVYQGGKN